MEEERQLALELERMTLDDQNFAGNSQNTSSHEEYLYQKYSLSVSEYQSEIDTLLG